MFLTPNRKTELRTTRTRFRLQPTSLFNYKFIQIEQFLRPKARLPKITADFSRKSEPEICSLVAIWVIMPRISILAIMKVSKGLIALQFVPDPEYEQQGQHFAFPGQFEQSRVLDCNKTEPALLRSVN